MKCAATCFLLTLAVAAVTSSADPIDIDNIWRDLIRVSYEADETRASETAAFWKSAGIQLEAWHCSGPFKDAREEGKAMPRVPQWPEHPLAPAPGGWPENPTLLYNVIIGVAAYTCVPATRDTPLFLFKKTGKVPDRVDSIERSPL